MHADRDLVVVDKPAGMPGVPDQPGARGTMADCARTPLLAMGRGPDTPLDAVRRLDRDTSGLAVYVRGAEANGNLAARAGSRRFASARRRTRLGADGRGYQARR